MKRRIAVRAIIEKDGKLLLVKLKPYDTAEPEDYWCTVGGGVDVCEPLEDAIVREIIEETGIAPVIGNLLYVMQWKNEQDDVENIEFFFHVTNSSDFTKIDLSKTTHGEAEIAEMAFINPKEAYILPKFLNDIDYTDIANKPTQFFNYL